MLMGKLFRVYELVIIGAMIILLPILVGRVDTHFINIILTNNYITVIINIYFLITLYKKIRIINHVKYHMITRLKLKDFKKISYFYGIIDTLVYCFILYGFMCLIYGFNGIDVSSMIHLIIYTVIYFIEVFIMLSQVNREDNIVYIVVAIMINLLYHYLFLVS